MHLRKRGRIWYGTVYVDGHATERSTGCTDKAAARAVLGQWEREAADPHRAAAQATLNDALSLLLDDRSARVAHGDGSAATVRFYQQKAGHLLRLLGHELLIGQLKDASQTWRYIDARRQEGAKPVTIEKELIALRSALKLARERGLWRGDIDAVIPATFAPQYVPKNRSPTRDEVLSLLPHLSPGSAAAVCFVLATAAESAALHAAQRSDVPEELDAADLRVRVRGTKNKFRDARVAIVSDEQRLLLAYAVRHAQGTGSKLFGPLDNLRRELNEAAKRAKVAPLSPHDLRRAAGQWLIDLGMPLELVSRVLRHADTRITETVYARVRERDLADRMIDAIDPRYARDANSARPLKPLIKTITELPAPKQRRALYRIDCDERTLAQWARARGVPKSTLHHRVVTLGMSMERALELGKGRPAGLAPPTASPVIEPKRKKRETPPTEAPDNPASARDSMPSDCRTGAGELAEKVHSVDVMDAVQPTPELKKPRKKRGSLVPRDGIEPPTRGFSILCSTD